jgi:PIN domain nuclease of toxin-antitoxin system
VRLLLDTHIAIWAVVDDPRLSKKARALIDDAGNQAFISLVSLWEVALRRNRTPRAIGLSVARAAELFQAGGASILPLQIAHAEAFEALPARHGDPFDRMLIAQALHEQLRLVTHDKTVARYSDTFILV